MSEGRIKAHVHVKHNNLLSVDMLPELLSPTIEESPFTPQLPFIPRMSTVAVRGKWVCHGHVTTPPITGQLDKFDDSIQKQLDEKLALLRSLQVSVSGYESVIIFIL